MKEEEEEKEKKKKKTTDWPTFYRRKSGEYLCSISPVYLMIVSGLVMRVVFS